MKKTKINSSVLSTVVSFVLIAAMVLSFASCSSEKKDNDNTSSVASVVSEVVSEASSQSAVIGEGEKSFAFEVVTNDGKKKSFTVNTNKENVGEALLELDMIAGDKGEYGLYVKTVDGETLDYDTDGKYWAFYVNGEYATAGVDLTAIENGATYSFKAE